jgi:hypothetical protein
MGRLEQRLMLIKQHQAAKFSSNWNNGTNAGTFNWNLNNATSNVNRNISTRLTNFIILLRSTLPLGKTERLNAVLVGVIYTRRFGKLIKKDS